MYDMMDEGAVERQVAPPAFFNGHVLHWPLPNSGLLI